MPQTLGINKQERTRGWARAVRNGQRSRFGDGKTGSACMPPLFAALFNRQLAKRSGCRAGWSLVYNSSLQRSWWGNHCGV